MSERGSSSRWVAPRRRSATSAILRRFASLCGARLGRIAIIPTASELDDTGERYDDALHRTRRPVARWRCRSRRGSMRRAWSTRAPSMTWTASSSPAATSSAFPRCSAVSEWRKAIRRRNAAASRRRHVAPARRSSREHMIAFGAEGAYAARRHRDAGAGPRPHQPDHHRPALPPARPARPPAHRAGVQSVRRRHRARRGHRRLHRAGRNAPGGRRAARSPSSIRPSSSSPRWREPRRTIRSA